MQLYIQAALAYPIRKYVPPFVLVPQRQIREMDFADQILD